MDPTSILLLVAAAVAFFFLIIRPQRKRQAAQVEMRKALAPGAEIMSRSASRSPRTCSCGSCRLRSARCLRLPQSRLTQQPPTLRPPIRPRHQSLSA